MAQNYVHAEMGGECCERAGTVGLDYTQCGIGPRCGVA